MMSTAPSQQWLAHRPRRGPHPVDTVVIHAVDSVPIDHLIQTLREQGRSYHYIIDPAGALYRTVPYCSVAHHAGNSYGPHEAARGIGRQQDARHHFVEMTCVNEYTISICLVRDGIGFSRVQRDACRDLLQELKTRLPKMRWVTTHADVAPGQTDPIEDFDLNALVQAVGLEAWTG